MIKFKNDEYYIKRIFNVLKPSDINHLVSSFFLDVTNIHGIKHWIRVACNGLMLADNEGISDNIVVLFAFYHDAKRYNDGFDIEHGERGGDYLLDSMSAFLPRISKEEIEVAAFACRGHNNGSVTSYKEVGVCWDADRLDLYRVGLNPHDYYLSTSTAMEEEVKEWANRDYISAYNKEITIFNKIAKETR